MKSRFKYSAYLVAFATILFAIILLTLFVQNINSNKFPLVPLSFISAFFVFIWTWMFFGELRTKVIYIEIRADHIKVKRYLGFGFSKIFYLEDITGFKISILPSKAGSYEYLYLMVGDRKIAKLSEFYHSNYKELKSCMISLGIKRLGTEVFSN
jgi:uncharacterized integral membrane protein